MSFQKTQLAGPMNNITPHHAVLYHITVGSGWAARVPDIPQLVWRLGSVLWALGAFGFMALFKGFRRLDSTILHHFSRRSRFRPRKCPKMRGSGPKMRKSITTIITTIIPITITITIDMAVLGWLQRCYDGGADLLAHGLFVCR